MKQEKALNEVIYLPEYFTGQLSQTMQKQKPPEILYWDFTKSVSEIVKLQIEIHKVSLQLANTLVKSMKRII